MRISASLVALLLWLAPSPGIEAQSPASLTIATYNLNAGMAGNRQTLAALESLSADVIFLQESNRGWERIIRQRLARRYPHMAFRSWPEPWGSLGVLSKVPFSKKLLAPKSGPFPAWLVSLKTAGGRLDILNVHLFPPVRWFHRLGWMRAYTESQVVHAKELRGYFTGLLRAPDLVVGDFNEDTLGRGLRWLAQRGYSPALAKRTNTWRWKTKVGTVRWPLDHIMHSTRFVVRSAKVIEAGSSDHYPVVVTLEVR